MNHGQEHITKPERHFKQITDNNRHTIQTLKNKGFSVKDISVILGFHRSSIYRELNRGKVIHQRSDLSKFTTYSADRGIEQARINETNKGPKLKIGTHQRLSQSLTNLMTQGKASPYAALEICKQQLTSQYDIEHMPCSRTIYNYINKYEFPITPSQMIHRKRKNKAKPAARRNSHKSRVGMSIENRPKEIKERKEIGHHEMDLVVGAQGTKSCLLVITERCSRFEHIIKLPDKTQDSVRLGLNRLERHYGKEFKELFKTITCDNGSEFLDPDLITQSCRGKAPRCQLYYAHPYCSSERGSNENANRLIRRFIPKGLDMKNVTQQDVNHIANWMNKYPRKLLDGRCSEALAKRFTFHSTAS